MSSQFTPGPWYVRPDYREEEGNDVVVGYDIVSGNKEVVGCEGIYSWHENDEANAHLIAAAPDLYNGFAMALSQMETAAFCVEAGRLDEALLHLRSLRHRHLAHLAKARGES